MTYADNYNIRTTSVKFNDVADALDGLITRNYAGLTTGTSTAYIATPTPAWDAYTTAGLVVIIPHVSNSGASTLNISGLGARDLKIGNSAIASGVLQQNIPTLLAYTGTYFEVLLQSISIPVGTIYSYAGSTAPAGYLLCDGAALNTYTYRTLHAITSNIYGGTAYNPGTTDQPGALTTFNLPDLSRRIPVGKGASDTLGASDGVVYASRSLSHSHSVPPHYHGMGTGATLNITSSGGNSDTKATGISIANHDISHSHAASMSPSGAHNHSQKTIASFDDGVSANYEAYSFDGLRGPRNISSTSSDHTHAITVGGMSANSSPSHTITDSGHFHSIAHTHSSANFSGAIGLVTGGVDGNSAMTSGSSTQPYLVLNYIIKT